MAVSRRVVCPGSGRGSGCDQGEAERERQRGRERVGERGWVRYIYIQRWIDER